MRITTIATAIVVKLFLKECREDVVLSSSVQRKLEWHHDSLRHQVRVLNPKGWPRTQPAPFAMERQAKLILRKSHGRPWGGPQYSNFPLLAKNVRTWPFNTKSVQKHTKKNKQFWSFFEGGSESGSTVMACTNFP
jgi:hypothetical protein